MHNITEMEPVLAYFNKKIALAITSKIYNWKYFNREMIIKHGEDIVCSPDSNKID